MGVESELDSLCNYTRSVTVVVIMLRRIPLSSFRSCNLRGGT